MSANFEQSRAGEAAEMDPSDGVAVAPIMAQRVVTVGPTPAESADRAFVAALRRTSLMRDLEEGELSRLLAQTTSLGEHERQLDLLALYYAAGDEEARTRRLRSDRFVLHHASSGENAHAIVRRLAAVAPDLGRPSLERIGADDGPLVLRAEEHICAVSEEDDDLTSSDEVDLSELDERFVTVRALVRAANVILKRLDVRWRWVLLRVDGRREAFVAVDADSALELCQHGLLEERSATRLLDFCSF